MLDVNNLTQTEKRIISLASSIKKEFTSANNPLITFFAGFGGASMADIFRDGKIGPNSMNSFLSGAPLNAAGSAFVVLMAKMVVAYKNAKYKKAAEEKLI